VLQKKQLIAIENIKVVGRCPAPHGTDTLGPTNTWVTHLKYRNYRNFGLILVKIK
jgi:hypothetical protein